MKKQSFLKGSAILLSMVLITKILGLMYKIPLTNLLGGTGMGYFSAAFSVFTPIFAVVVSGIPSTMARLTAENYALERFSNLRKTRRAAYLVFGVISTIAALLMILSAGFLSDKVIGEPSTKYALISVAPSMIFCTLMSVERGYFEGLQNMTPTAVSEIIETLFKLLLGLGFSYGLTYKISDDFERTGELFGKAYPTAEQAASAALPYISAAAILGSSLASGIACLYIFISARVHGDGVTKQMLAADKLTDPLSHTAKRLCKFCAPIALISVITTFANMIDMLTINPCISKAIAQSPESFSRFTSQSLDLSMLPNFIYGSYTGLAITVFGLVPTLTAMFGKSILPSLTECYTKCNKAQMQENLNKMMMITSVIAIPAGLGIAVLAKPILCFLFGSRPTEISVCAQPMAILGIAVIFLGISTPCFAILQTLGRPKTAVLIMLFGGIIKLALNIVLIPLPMVNISGAALSTLVSNIFICICSVKTIYSLASAKCRWTELYLKPFYAAVMCAVTALLSYDVMSKAPFFQQYQRLSTLFCILFGSIMYAFCLYLLCETPKNIVKSVFSKKIQ
ncbi:polysaccharide biosynthesis C-terminal domain-containing protein [Ruminococcus sp.]|uniref:oligosaccharide flippase family protein n=1 Tax=Ruminococcus sp. TaxID=41978 RepID=UPI0025E4732F|nr:polysaccharide biosynthesis C-terminal domain-containing protein [Ruminococcus sp.]